MQALVKKQRCAFLMFNSKITLMNTQLIRIDGHHAPVHVWPAQHNTDLTPLHFAHANGFPAGSYDKLLRLLAQERTVYAMDHRATWDSSPYQPPSEFTWHSAADDLIAAIEQVSPNGVIGVGHSLGAVSTLLAAIKRPDLFKQILLVEPVMFPTRMFVMFAGVPKPLRAKVFGLVKKTLLRRERWTTREEFTQALGGKSLFKGFSAEVFQDYATHGLRESSQRAMPGASNDMLTLSFRKTWEAQVFLTPPYVWQKIKRLQVPCVVWRGEVGDVVPMHAWQKWEKIRPESPVRVLPKLGHMAPLQSPILMANEIQKNLLSI